MRKQPIAVVNIRGAAKMTAEDRKGLAAWLRKHASDLLREGAEYKTRFTGRYWVR